MVECLMEGTKVDWLVLAFALQLGYTPNDTAIQYQANKTIWDSDSSLIISMDAELRAWNTIYIGGSLAVPTWISTGASLPTVTIGSGGWPSTLQSVIRAGVRLGGVEIGWSHLCTHPVMPYQPLLGTQTLWEGFYDEFHIKFAGEFHF
jgi:hypothetical protein